MEFASGYGRWHHARSGKEKPARRRSGRKKAVNIALYMSQLAYASAARAVLTQNPDDRIEAIGQLALRGIPIQPIATKSGMRSEKAGWLTASRVCSNMC
jgi:hypothetical protein